jgi:hypothetical protein
MTLTFKGVHGLVELLRLRKPFQLSKFSLAITWPEMAFVKGRSFFRNLMNILLCANSSSDDIRTLRLI